MRHTRATGWLTAALLAVVLPAAGFVSSCGSSENGETAPGEAADSGLVQPVSADAGVAEARVARVTFFDGGVAARPVGAEEWETFEVNAPIFEGYELYAEEDAHAEIMLGEQKYARFGDGADVTVTRLDPDFAQFELGSGVMTLALDEYVENEYYEINTPGGAFIPRQAGSYRVDVLPDGQTRVTVLRGLALVTTPEGQFEVAEGDVVNLGFDTPVQVDVISGAAPQYRDDWDDWSYERDVYYDEYYTDYDVPEPVRVFDDRNDIYGIAQLAAFGLWAALDDDDDRYCWQPYAARDPGWSPYYDGYWDYAPVTGWTWISREEWGWAPYHYGRWDHHATRGWVWFPDHAQRISAVTVWNEPYVWYPSQVYFYQPPRQNNYVWVPLAPGEPYYPYSATIYGTPNVQVVDFRPRFLREQRAVYYVSGDQLFDQRRDRPRRLAREQWAAFALTDEGALRPARLAKPDRIVALGEVAPARLRPNKLARERAVVVSDRAIERAERRAARLGPRAEIAKQGRAERQIRRAEKGQLKVNKRQLAADARPEPLRVRGNKAARVAADRQQAGGGREARQLTRAERRTLPKAERQQLREQRRAARQATPRAERQQQRAERQQQRQAAPRVERQQRAERQQQRKATPRAERQQRQRAPRAERQQLRQQRQVQRQQRQRAPRAERQQLRQQRAPRAERQQLRQQRQAAPRVERQQMRQQRRAARQQQAAPRVQRQQVRQQRQATRQQAAPRAERKAARQERQAARQQKAGGRAGKNRP